MKNILHLAACMVAAATCVVHASAEKLPLRIGAIVPLTGPAASYGRSVQNGFALASTENPEDLKQVQVVWEDSQLDSKSALSAYRKLISSDKVDLIFVWGVGPAETVAPIAEQEHVPTIAITADRGISIGKKSVFRFHYNADDYVQPLVRFIVEKKLKKLAIVSTQMAYYAVIEKALRSELGGAATIEEAANVTPEETDFRTPIIKMQHSKIDGVFIFLLPGQISSFHQQAQNLGFHTAMFGTDFYDNQEEVKKAGPNALGTIFPAFAVSEQFRASYTKRFGNDEQLPYAANSYDFFNFLSKMLVERKGGAKDLSLIDSLRTAPPYLGISGKYVFADSPKGGGFDVQVTLKQVRDGKAEYLNPQP